MKKEVMDLFFRKVNKTEYCWLWTRHKDKDGYGRVTIDGRDLRSHRVSYEFHNGPIPKGKLICHKCDNPPCVNPAHLFVGTFKDNNRDAINKGRCGRGSRKKISNKQVKEIRKKYKPKKYTMCRLALEYKVSKSLIYRVIKDSNYRNLH